MIVVAAGAVIWKMLVQNVLAPVLVPVVAAAVMIMWRAMRMVEQHYSTDNVVMWYTSS
jgi:hypothetical protein